MIHDKHSGEGVLILIRELISSNDGEGFKLYRAYSKWFNSSNIGIGILKDCIEVQEKIKKVVVLSSCPPQNVKLGIFTS